MERANSTDSVESQSMAQDAVTGRKSTARSSASSRLSEWQRFFLDRLEHLLELRQSPDQDAPTSQLVSKAMYSTYLDCQGQGVGDEALRRITASGQRTPSDN